jgi:hypothetical protein
MKKRSIQRNRRIQSRIERVTYRREGVACKRQVAWTSRGGAGEEEEHDSRSSRHSSVMQMSAAA